jgi:hypothetical protein
MRKSVTWATVMFWSNNWRRSDEVEASWFCWTLAAVLGSSHDQDLNGIQEVGYPEDFGSHRRNCDGFPMTLAWQLAPCKTDIITPF